MEVLYLSPITGAPHPHMDVPIMAAQSHVAHKPNGLLIYSQVGCSLSTPLEEERVGLDGASADREAFE